MTSSLALELIDVPSTLVAGQVELTGDGTFAALFTSDDEQEAMGWMNLATRELFRIELAKPVQTYANCFVKRNRPSWTLSTDAPAPEPSPSGLKLRELPDEPEETR